MQAKDEVLIQLRDDMKESAIIEVLRQLSQIEHRLIQISITAGAKVAHPFLASLLQSAGNLEGAIYLLQQANAQKSGIVGVDQQAGFIRPQ
jgi:hypothetical protein